MLAAAAAETAALSHGDSLSLLLSVEEFMFAAVSLAVTLGAADQTRQPRYPRLNPEALLLGAATTLCLVGVGALPRHCVGQEREVLGLGERALAVGHCTDSALGVGPGLGLWLTLTPSQVLTPSSEPSIYITLWRDADMSKSTMTGAWSLRPRPVCSPALSATSAST